MLKTPYTLSIWFQRYSHFGDAQNNKMQGKLSYHWLYLKINNSEFRLILLDHITFVTHYGIDTHIWIVIFAHSFIQEAELPPYESIYAGNSKCTCKEIQLIFYV